MGREEEAQQIAEAIMKDSKPWNSILGFTGDWTLFSEETVRESLSRRITSKEDITGLIEVIMADPNLGCQVDLIDALISIVYQNFCVCSDFLEEVLKHACNEVLKGPIHDWFIEVLRMDQYVIPFYELLSQDVRLRDDSQLVEALKSNMTGIKTSLREIDNPWDLLVPIAHIPEIFLSDEVLEEVTDIVFQYNDPSYVLSRLRRVEELQDKEEFWNKLIQKFMENDHILLEDLQDAFGLKWLLVPQFSHWTDARNAKERLNNLIETKGWPLMRLSLLSEVRNAELYCYNSGMITETEMEETRNRFFEILGIESLSGYRGDLRDIVREIEWKGSFDQLETDVFDRALFLLESQIHASGSTHSIEIKKLEKTRAARLIPEILELRNDEIEHAEVKIYNRSCVDLRPLWQCKYGRDILKARQVWQFCSTDKLREIEEDLKQLGFRIRVTHAEYNECSDITPQPEYRLGTVAERTASYNAFADGLRLLAESQHPEALEIGLRLIKRFPWMYYTSEGWKVDGLPFPFDEIIALLGKMKQERSFNTLISLLQRPLCFDDSNSRAPSIRATILSAIETHHDSRVIRPIIVTLYSVIKHIEEVGSLPRPAMDELDTFLMAAVDILKRYKPIELFEPLLGIYDRLFHLRFFNWPEANEYRARMAVLEGIRMLELQEEHITLLIDRLTSQREHVSEDMAGILESLGLPAIEKLIQLMENGNDHEARVARSILGRMGDEASTAVRKHIDSKKKMLSDTERQQTSLRGS
ncbi:MAG: hypothetical protein ACTSV3_06605 [Candidatus Thorarchaeota archaeon]|nr:MAG: hypothetical protein DRP09_07950 [Candidatus Thorarchaeota archaeon]